jgi:hypothetical protein
MNVVGGPGRAPGIAGAVGWRILERFADAPACGLISRGCRMTTRRSFELSLLSVAFVGLTIAAFAYARRVAVDPTAVLQLGVRPRAVTNLVVMAGLCAAGVAVTAWIGHRLLPWAVTCWGLCVGAMLIEFQRRPGVQGEPLWLVAFPYLVLALLVWVLVAFAANRV